MPAPDELCRCGHARELHDHLRRGSDCAECGADGCAAFRAAGARARVTRWIGLRDRLARRRPHRGASDGVVLRHPTSSRRATPPARARGDDGAAAAGDVPREA